MIIKGSLYLEKSNIISLGNLERVEIYLDLSNCINLIDLGNLKYVKQIIFSDSPKLRKLSNDLEIEEIYNFDKSFEFLKNWKGLKKLKKLQLGLKSLGSNKFDFFNIPDFLENKLNIIHFTSIKHLYPILKQIDFEKIPKNYKHYDFLINCLIENFKDKTNNKKTISRIKKGFEINWKEKWGGKHLMYSSYSDDVNISCYYDIINARAHYEIDASGLIQNEKDIEEDEDPENYGHIYTVRNVKINNIENIEKINSSSDIIELGESLGIRYDY